MVIDELIHVLSLDVAVPNLLRLTRDHGSVGALSETARTHRPHHPLQAPLVDPRPEPVEDLAAAGLRAAMRVIDLALPMLEAGQSLRFAIMPEGLDPDDVLKSKGNAEMQKLLGKV